MGLIKGEVKLEQYDIKWQADFLAEKTELEKIFGEVALEISDVMGNQAGCPVVEDAGDFTGQRIGMPIGQQRNQAV